MRLASTLSAQGKSILDHLLKTESDAEAYYRDLATKAKNDGFRNIFLMIAKEEAKHTEWLSSLAKDGGALGAAVLLNQTLLGDAKCVFQGMTENRKDLNKLCEDQIELYRAARDIEAQSRDFYAERAKHATDPALKKLLETIAIEEDKHYRLLHGLLQFISEEEGGYEVDALNFWVNMDEPLADMGKP
jgi:rubrerythrin